jgi:hypothetical protein
MMPDEGADAPPAIRHAGRWIVIAFALAALPILLISFPPILDYPNHLTRIWLLAGGVNSPPLSSMYAADWSQASTNIGVDLAATALAHILPFAVVDKMLQMAMFLGPPLGCALLNRTLFGRFHAWQIGFPILAWSTTAIAGFLNFQIGLGAALLAAVISPSAPGRWPLRALAIYFSAALVLLLIHPFSLFFYAVLMSGILIGEKTRWPVPHQRRQDMARGIVLLAIACAIPLLLLFVFAAVPPGAHVTLGSEAPWQWRTFLNPGRILKLLASPFLTYDARYDLLLMAPVGAMLAYALATRHVRAHAGLLLAAAGLLVLSIAAPATIGDATWIQRRIPPMLALTLAAGIQPTFRRAGANRTLALVLALTLCARVAWIGRIWLIRQTDAAQMFAATRILPPGAAVILLRQDWSDAANVPLGRLMAGGPGKPIETQRHLPALLVMKRHIFIPTLFTVPGQQPLRVLGQWKARSVPVSALPTAGTLNQRQPTDAYLHHWRRDFDYILLINADLATSHPLPTAGLRQLADTHFAKLYLILRNPRRHLPEAAYPASTNVTTRTSR